MYARRSQDGQVLVLGMLVAALLSVALLRYFSAAQVLAAKSRQVHGLDAATYSGALIQARALNMLAYLNRAQLAHQVAMAHLTTLGSWALYGGAQASQLARGNPPAHLIGMLFGADHGRAYLAASRASGLGAWASSSGALGEAHAAHNRFVHDVYGEVSESVVNGLPAARLAAIQTVLARHYPESEPSDFKVTVSADDWPGFTQRMTPVSQLHPLVARIASLYAFLAPRNHTAANNWVVSERCPTLRHQLRRRGSTQMDAAGRWQSSDTQSYHALRSNRWIGCYYREYAMGWAWVPGAAAQRIDGAYSDAVPENFAEQDFWRWVQEATQWNLLDERDNPMANSYAMRSRPIWNAGGLAPYYDVAVVGTQGVAGFSVGLTRPGPEDTLVHAQSAAQTYFARPDQRLDGQYEGAHLFHPYWHARLASPGRDKRVPR
ncbi:hypothetical protein KVP09_01895 [Alcaligenaceae bacterium CGII-47]|nr:hypothetical protein [Alcaligenaceae bacterium CGII-47]